MTLAGSDMKVDYWTDLIGGLAERHPALCRRIADRETRMLGDRLEEARVDRPVYIAGIARSGSTILLELLARHPDIATHRYRDFPLVMTPWSWNWFIDRAGRPDQPPAERAHRDRIAVTPESPEAFEEVLWMAFFEDAHDPKQSAVLTRNTSNAAFERFYEEHILKLLLLRGGHRYLAKGNYNITRLAYLRRIFPDARFVVPVRDPLWHVASLMKQHALFSGVGEGGPRIRRHLRRAGHFEFGPDRQTINTGNPEVVAEIEALWAEGREVEGWALHWASVYGHVADTLARDADLASATRLARYETFCADPAAEMRALLDHCGLSHGDLPEQAAARVSAPDYYEPAFSDAERAALEACTAPVLARLGTAG
ncbi:sulfotransferase [Paroceanicella profunda]|nr:sulfotransferase [Paroceanicella profunda]